MCATSRGEAIIRLMLVGSNRPPQGGSGAQQSPGGILAYLLRPGPSGEFAQPERGYNKAGAWGGAGKRGQLIAASPKAEVAGDHFVNADEQRDKPKRPENILGHRFLLNRPLTRPCRRRCAALGPAKCHAQFRAVLPPIHLNLTIHPRDPPHSRPQRSAQCPLGKSLGGQPNALHNQPKCPSSGPAEYLPNVIPGLWWPTQLAMRFSWWASLVSLGDPPEPLQVTVGLPSTTFLLPLPQSVPDPPNFW